MRLSRNPIFAALVLALFSLLPAPAGGEEASPWYLGHKSRARLIAAGGESGAVRLAGIEIALEKGFKTYWRHPGESGLPPTFDWSASDNVADIEVLYPAPQRFEDASGVTYGYDGRVILPVRVKPKDADKPIRLGLRLGYGVCKDICIPAEAELSLNLAVADNTPFRAAIEAAMSEVPRPQPLGADAALSILNLEPRQVDGKTLIAAAARIPVGGKPVLFVEAPEGWYLAPRMGLMPSDIPGASGIILIEIQERPPERNDALDLRLTLVAGGRAIETSAHLDTAKLPR